MDPARNALRRPYQDAVLNEFIKEQTRLWALLWERQAGKSTTMADFALTTRSGGDLALAVEVMRQMAARMRPPSTMTS